MNPRTNNPGFIVVVLAAVALVGGYTITKLYRDTHWPRPVHVASGQAPRVIELAGQTQAGRAVGRAKAWRAFDRFLKRLQPRLALTSWPRHHVDRTSASK